MGEAIKVDGLAQFTRSLKRLDKDLPKAVRVGLNEVADLIVDEAASKVPRRTGRAAKSLKARSTTKEVRVAGGGKRAPYYPWLDFGGTVGRGRVAGHFDKKGRRRNHTAGSVSRPFQSDGRYLYPSYFKRRDSGEIVRKLEKVFADVARKAGLEVT